MKSFIKKFSTFPIKWLGLSYLSGIIIRIFMILAGKHKVESYLADFIQYTVAAICILGAVFIVMVICRTYERRRTNDGTETK